MMKAIIYLFAFGISFFCLPRTKAEENWHTVQNEFFSFSLPNGFKKLPDGGDGGDSFGEAYEDKGVQINFDYGYWLNLDDNPIKITVEDVVVDGEAVQIKSQEERLVSTYIRFSASIQFSRCAAHGKMAMAAACRDEAGLALAKKIFQTIRFVRKPTPKPQ